MPPSFRLLIEDVAFGGRGVGRLEDGRVVFVPFVLAGERVEVEIVREHRSYLEARLLKVLEPSPRRVTPRCPYFGRCGGCSYQHADPAEQLAIKERQVGETLRRVGRLELPAGGLRPIVSSPENFGYRNRITVHVRDDAVGYFSHPDAGREGRELLDITHCPIAEPAVNAALAGFRGQRRPRRDGHHTLRAADRRDRRWFQQTNDGGAARLLALVRERLFADGDPPHAHLIDAYCGAGFFSRALAGEFARVTGLEWDRHAAAAAREGAAPHERYLGGEVGALLPGALAEAPAAETVVIADPPAEGLSKAVVGALRAAPPAVFIYVSCNPATLARDLARLLARPAGAAPPWELLSVTPLDMFPQTAEIEAVAHFRRIPAA